ncbi:MAG: hypothetical protein WCS43_11910 [Verrucomicrobiota bacterium]
MKTDPIIVTAITAIGLACASLSRAELLLYEGFAYPQGSFATGVSGGGTGFAAGSTWKTDNTGTGTTASDATRYVFDGVPNTPTALDGETWDGVFNGLTGSGNFVGANTTGGKHVYFARPVDATTFAPQLQNGQTLWMSYVANGGTNGNRRTALILSSGPGILDRGRSLGTGQGGEAAGVSTWAAGTPTSWSVNIHPVIYKDLASDGTSEQLNGGITNNSGTFTTGDQLLIVKFQWGATDADADTVSVYNLAEPAAGTTNLSAVIDESFFNANAKSVNQILNQRAFTTLVGMSIHGFAHFDEIRIGKSFKEVIGDNTPPSNYKVWTDASGLTGDDALFGSDPNHDGIANGLAFSLGAANANTDASPLLPTASIRHDNDSDFFEFVYRRASTASAFTSSVEYSQTLGSWTTASDGVDGVTITVTPDGFETGVDQIVVSIPAAGRNKIFARLTVCDTTP